MKLSRSIVFVAALAASAGSAMAQGEQAYGITGASAGNIGVNLIRFNTANPAGFTTVGALTGVAQGHSVRGVDFRPFNGSLYALSTNAGGTEMAIYDVNLGTGALTQIGATITGLTSPATQNNRFSIDFNPSVDRLRVITEDGRSYRINPITGGLAGTDTNAAIPGTTPAWSAIAYDNNIHNNGPTTLYAWNWNDDDLYTIGGIGGTPSPNTGQTFPVAPQPGFITQNRAMGFDISSSTGFAYLSYDTSTDIDGIAILNLATGLPSGFTSFNAAILDFSIVIPSPSAGAALGLLGVAALRRRR